MRIAALLLAFMACSHAMNAQLSLLPQVGFENSRTIIQYNDQNMFSPLGVKFSPQASLRLNYASKQGHGFFIGAATSRSTVVFNVADAENGISNYKAMLANMQVRLEGGYQFSSPKINLGKSKGGSTVASMPATSTVTQSNSYSSRCRQKSYSSARCGMKSSSARTAAPDKVKGTSWMRLQPSIGMGLIPAVKTDIVSWGQGYEYRAGNWNTALITGANIEFGKNNTSLFTVSVNYFNAMGNLGKQTISTVNAGKTTTTVLQSDVSGWNVRVGIPFSLSKSTAAKTPKAPKVEKAARPERNKCGQYRVGYYRYGRSL